jgi:hypothetical protein
MLKINYAIVHAYHLLALDRRLGVVIHFADHLRTVRYKDRQVSVTVGLSIHVACLALCQQPFLVCVVRSLTYKLISPTS